MWDCPWPAPELVGVVSAIQDRQHLVALELGCGGGSDAVFLARAGMRVIGVDLSCTAISIGRSRGISAGVDVNWCVGDALRLPLQDASVDFMADRGCFHHIEPGDRHNYAAEALRVLRTGGILFLQEMADPEQIAYPVTTAVVEEVFGLAGLSIRSAFEYTMLGANGSGKGTMAIIDRVTLYQRSGSDVDCCGL